MRAYIEEINTEGNRVNKSRQDGVGQALLFERLYSIWGGLDMIYCDPDVAVGIPGSHQLDTIDRIRVSKHQYHSDRIVMVP